MGDFNYVTLKNIAYIVLSLWFWVCAWTFRGIPPLYRYLQSDNWVVCGSDLPFGYMALGLWPFGGGMQFLAYMRRPWHGLVIMQIALEICAF